MPHRWNRVSMYVRRNPKADGSEPMSLDPRDHVAIQEAIEKALGGLEVAEFSAYRLGDELPSTATHPHVVIDLDVYSAMVEAIRQMRRTLDPTASESDRIAAALLVQRAMDGYQEACDVSASRPPHPQIEGPGWRHY